MNSHEDAQFRLDLAVMSLRQANNRLTTKEWHSCVAEAQLAVENAAKSLIACFRPVPRTHDVAGQLELILQDTPSLQQEVVDKIKGVIALAERHGLEEHIAVTYGDESTRTPPWALFDEKNGRDAIADAETAVQAAEWVLDWRFPKQRNKS